MSMISELVRDGMHEAGYLLDLIAHPILAPFEFDFSGLDIHLDEADLG